MKYRICENKKGKFKIQKRYWFIFPYWNDVKRTVRESYKIPGTDTLNYYTKDEVLFDSFIAAKNRLIWITNKYKKQEKMKSENHVWHCRGEYGKNVKWDE